MKNPWTELGNENILPIDRDFIEKYQQNVQKNNRVQSQLNPFPFFGFPDKSKIVILLSNPGYAPVNSKEHSRTLFSKQYRGSLTHKEIHPYLDKKFSDTSGFQWWENNIFRDLKRDIPDFYGSNILEKIMCVQMFPYHSTEFDKRLAQGLPSFDYSYHLVKNAISAGKIVIALRAPWRDFLAKAGLLEKSNVIAATLHGQQKPVLDRHGKWIKNIEYDAIKRLLQE